MTIAPDEIDVPSVRGEIEAVAMAYERALLAGDVATLDAMFWDDRRALRFGIADIQHGIDEVRAFRAKLPLQSRPRDISRLEVHTFGNDCAVVNIEFLYRDGPGGGRQSQTWVRVAPGQYGGWRVVSAHVDLTRS